MHCLWVIIGLSEIGDVINQFGKFHGVPKSTLSEDFSLVKNDNLYEDIGMIFDPKQVFSVMLYFGITQFLASFSLTFSRISSTHPFFSFWPFLIP